MKRRLPWILWGVSVGLSLATVVLMLLAGGRAAGTEGSLAFDAVLALGLLTFPTVGLVIASRRPENVIGWLFCAVGVPFALSSACFAYTTYTLGAGGPLPGGEIAAWLNVWLFLPSLFGLPALLFLLFPDGHLLGPRWRPVLWLTLAAMVGVAAAPALRPGEMPDAAVKGTVNPLGIDGADAVIDWLEAVAGLAALLSIALATASLVIRFRRSRGVERQQLKWFASAALLFALACVSFLALAGSLEFLGQLLILTCYALIPVAAGVAILRHRLYDIDVVINRALVYGALTATLGATYLGAGAAGRARSWPLGLRGRGLDARRGRALPPRAGGDPGCGGPALLPPALRRGAHAGGVRHALARRGRSRGADRRPARRGRRHRPARPRLGVAAMRRALRAIWRAAVASPAMRWLPWAIWVLVVGVFAAISGAALDDGLVQFISYLLFVLAFTTVGALVASRRPRNAIGWLLLLAGGSYVLGGLSEHAVDGGNASALVAWVGEWIWLAGIGPVATFGLLLFPTGHLPSPRWRPVAWLAAASVVASVMAIAFKPGRFEGSAIENPLGIPGLPDWTGTAALLVLLAAVAGSIASLRARYRAAGAAGARCSSSGCSTRRRSSPPAWWSRHRSKRSSARRLSTSPTWWSR